MNLRSGHAQKGKKPCLGGFTPTKIGRGDELFHINDDESMGGEGGVPTSGNDNNSLYVTVKNLSRVLNDVLKDEDNAKNWVDKK